MMYFVFYCLYLLPWTCKAVEVTFTLSRAIPQAPAKQGNVVIFRNRESIAPTKQPNVVIFKNRESIGPKVQKKCHQYVSQACNGILRTNPGANPMTAPMYEYYSSSTHTSANLPAASMASQASDDMGENFIVSILGPMYPGGGIVGGRITAPKEYPHMALIGYGEDSEVKWLCGGSLISDEYVLSAAHCVFSNNGGDARWVRLGELDLSTRTDDANIEDIEIIERIVHPEYKPPSLYNDIALFKLKTSVTFNDYVRPICLNVLQNLNVAEATATGWGSTGYGERESSELLSVRLNIENAEKCDKIYKGERLQNGFNSSTMICAGYAPGGKDTCQGDSGGPLVIDFAAGCSNLYLQIGIVSFGEGCAFPEIPAIYTKISYFIPWIERIVWK